MMAKRVARRWLERRGATPYPVMNLHEEDTPDLDSWRGKPALPEGHSELPGDEDEEDDLEGQEGKWSR